MNHQDWLDNVSAERAEEDVQPWQYEEEAMAGAAVKSTDSTELRDAIRYHRAYHRPFLLAAHAGSIRDCALYSCRAVMHELTKGVASGR
jgi:hypothetical protein